LKEAIKQLNASRKRRQVPVLSTRNKSSHRSRPKKSDTFDETRNNKACDLE
ncbi:hypothetical protein ACJMK2_029449, partial [Sinanodonta woodiana]